MKTCVFAGTFDPPTNGHIEVINKALEIFDKVVVGILINPDKTPFFTESERKFLLEKALKGKRVEVITYGGMLTDLLKEYDTNFYVRGVRNEVDYKYEKDMHEFNKARLKDLTTIFIQTTGDTALISSTNLRNLIKENKDFSGFVPQNIYEDIKNIIKTKG